MTARAFLGRCWRDPLLTIANTPLALAVTLVVTLLVSGGLFCLVEGVPVEDGLYWAVTTMSTTGYGDVTPQATAGKVLAGALMLWSIFYLLPAAIFHIGERLIVSVHQFSHEEQRHLLGTVDDVKRDVAHLLSTLVDSGQPKPTLRSAPGAWPPVLEQK